MYRAKQLNSLAQNFPSNDQDTKTLIQNLNFSDHECYIYADSLNLKGKFLNRVYVFGISFF